MPEAPSFDFRRETLHETIHRTAAIINEKYAGHYNHMANVRSLTKYGNGYRLEAGDTPDEQTQHPIHLNDTVRRSLAVSDTDNRLIDFLDPKTGRIRAAKPSTFLKFLNRLTTAGIPDESIQIIATVIGEQLPTKYGYDFTIVDGEAIRALYTGTSYTCMTNSVSLNFYVNNAPELQAVRITKDGALIGRAILWPLHDGRKYLDRVYPSSGPHLTLLSKKAKEEGWVERGTASAEITPAAHERLAKENLITIPLTAPAAGDVSAHSMGAFPYQDTFRWMKHSPNLTQAMLRFESRAGWLGIGHVTRYARHYYCPLLRGWVNEDALVNARVLDNDLSFRAETRFSRDILRRTHTLVRWPKEQGVRIQNTRAYVPNEFMADILIDTITGSHFLRQHAVTTKTGEHIFIEDALAMHDGTHLRSSEHLRDVAMLPNGRFILRDEATYNQDTREWQPKGNHE